MVLVCEAKKIVIEIGPAWSEAREGMDACDAIKMWKMGVQVETPSFFLYILRMFSGE